MLRAVGLSELDERAYRALLVRRCASVGDLACALTVPRGEVAGALRNLVEWGLAAPKGDGYVAGPPTVALGAILADRRTELGRAEAAMADLAELYRVAPTTREFSDLFEIITGVPAISDRFGQLQRGARSRVLVFVTAGTLAVAGSDNVAEATALARGVGYRAVLDREALAEPGALHEAECSLAAGADIRMVDRLPIKLVIADRDLALVPVGGRLSEPGAVLVHRSGLLDGLIALFEATWRGGRPLRMAADEHVSGGPALDDADVRILSLLLAGGTDRSVGTQLGLSPRTVQRRVRRLMDLAGTDNRMQLGWYARDAGWIV